MNKVTHDKGRDTSTLLIIPYIVDSVSGLGFNLTEKLVLISTMVLVVHCLTDLGTKFPDFDANDPNSLPIPRKDYGERTWVRFYRLFAVSCNKFIRSMGGRHRSKHTHTLMTYIVVLGVPAVLIKIYLADQSLIYWILHIELIALCLSCSIHVILDFFNYTGGYIHWFQKRPTNLLPDEIKIFGFRPFRFVKYGFKDWGVTGGDYELFFRRNLDRLNKLAMFLMAVTFTLSVFDISSLDVFMSFISVVTETDLIESWIKIFDNIKDKVGSVNIDINLPT